MSKNTQTMVEIIWVLMTLFVAISLMFGAVAHTQGKKRTIDQVKVLVHRR